MEDMQKVLLEILNRSNKENGEKYGYRLNIGEYNKSSLNTSYEFEAKEKAEEYFKKLNSGNYNTLGSGEFGEIAKCGITEEEKNDFLLKDSLMMINKNILLFNYITFKIGKKN